MGLQRVSQTSVALLRAGEKFDQGCSLPRISLKLLLQSNGDTSFTACDDPGISKTVVDNGAVRKSNDKHSRFVTEPGDTGELMLSLAWTSERNSTVSTVGVGREEDQGVVITLHLGLLLLLFLVNVVGTELAILEDIFQTLSFLLREIL